MKKLGTLLAAMAVSLLAIASLAGAVPSGDTLKVDDDGQQCDAEFTTINGAIAAAAPGDTIKVCPGLYSENVGVNKRLILNGSGPDNPRNRTGNTDNEAVVEPPNVLAPLSVLP